MSNNFTNQILASQDFFNRSTRVLEEADSQFRPQPGMWTVAQQVAHAAQTLDWFIEGATRPEGFNLDFQALAMALENVTSLEAAREMLKTAYGNVLRFLETSGPEVLDASSPRRTGDGRHARQRHLLGDGGAHSAPPRRAHRVFAPVGEGAGDAVRRLTRAYSTRIEMECSSRATAAPRYVPTTGAALAGSSAAATATWEAATASAREGS